MAKKTAPKKTLRMTAEVRKLREAVDLSGMSRQSGEKCREWERRLADWREDSTGAEVLNSLLSLVADKLPKDLIDDPALSVHLTLDINPPQLFERFLEGEAIEPVTCSGLACLVGSVTGTNSAGERLTVNYFSKWVSHPFWQYSTRTTKS